MHSATLGDSSDQVSPTRNLGSDGLPSLIPKPLTLNPKTSWTLKSSPFYLVLKVVRV